MRTWDEVGNDAQAKFNELSHKGWEWRSFYNGYLEGASSERQRKDVLPENGTAEEKEHDGQPIRGDLHRLPVEDQVRLYRASGGSLDGERRLQATLEADKTKHIRTDLVERLKHFAVHAIGCNVYAGQSTYDGVICHPAPCTCGVAEVLKEME